MISKVTGWAHPEKKRIFSFREGRKDDINLLGLKGANLCELKRLGLPVPPGFIVGTEACLELYDTKHEALNQIYMECLRHIHSLELESGHSFGNVVGKSFSLLLSVRTSSSYGNIPGMMETILNVGINDEIVESLASYTKNAKFAYDTYRRFIQMFGTSVLKVPQKVYEDILLNYLSLKSFSQLIHTSGRSASLSSMPDVNLDLDDLRKVIAHFKAVALFPQDIHTQLKMAIEAGLDSWFSTEAGKYRRANLIESRHTGCCVIVQAMVFGNLNSRSGTGVAFTRHPATGEDILCGEYLVCGEGEDVVNRQKSVTVPYSNIITVEYLSKYLPEVYDKLKNMKSKLESSKLDIQEIEFTVESGNLYILESRTPKRSAQASFALAVDMATANIITEVQGLMSISPKKMSVYSLLKVDDQAVRAEHLLGKGIGTSAGTVRGVVVFDAGRAKKRLDNGEHNIIYVVHEDNSSTAVTDGISAASLLSEGVVGVISMEGGLCSKIPSICRDEDISCVTGVSQSSPGVRVIKKMPSASMLDEDFQPILEAKYELSCPTGTLVEEGDSVVLDGATGCIYRADVPLVPPGDADPLKANYQRVLKWADKYRRMSVLGQVTGDKDGFQAVENGAHGVGLLRTEAMLLSATCINAARAILLCKDLEWKRDLVEYLYTLHQQDFLDVMKLYPGKTVSVRLSDTPPRQFFEDISSSELADLADFMKMEVATCLGEVKNLLSTPQDFQSYDRNDGCEESLSGYRGARVAMIIPDFVTMQTKAIIGAALELKVQGVDVHPSIIIPMAFSEQEITHIVPVIHTAANQKFVNMGLKIDYRIGVMMENPRACYHGKFIMQEDIAFLLFDTDSLTKHIFGFSRSDQHRYLKDYLQQRVLQSDPFKTIDQIGVGQLIQTAIANRDTKKKMQLGVCGSHSADPASLRFFEYLKFDYVVCEPALIPQAKVGASHARIKRVLRDEKENMLASLYLEDCLSL